MNDQPTKPADLPLARSMALFIELGNTASRYRVSVGSDVEGTLMGHANKVMKSINNPQQDRCVDIVMSPDGKFGFGEFRRDAETGEGWFPVGLRVDPIYPDFDAAMAEALANVPWLSESLTKELKKN